MPSSIDDLRFSLRSLGRTPAFTAGAALVLALGIGLNVAVFAVVNALLLAPLGGPAGGELVGVYDRDRAHPDDYRRFSYPAYRIVREHPGGLSEVLAHEQTSVGVTRDGISRRVFAALVSSNYFSTLAVRPAVGRDFRPEEEAVGAAPVAIVSDGYWRQQGGQPGLVGSTLRMNGRDVTIVGIAPAGFTGATALFSPDLWLPLGACSFLGTGKAGGEASGCLEDSQRRTLALLGRLRPGIGRPAATASLASLAPALAAENAESLSREVTLGNVSRLSIGAGPAGDREIALVMVFLSALALSVLLIASLNLANMLLARGTARQREIAIRFALGSSRLGVVRLLLTESAAIAVCGAFLGLGLAVAGTRLVAVAIAGTLPVRVAFDATPDVRVLAATLAFAVLAAIVCGLGPALGLARSGALSHLKDQAGQPGGRAGRMSTRNALVVFQLATSLALLTAAGLFVNGARAAAGADAGFSLDGGLVATISPALSGHAEARGRQAYDGVLARLRAHPTVASVSMASSVPFDLESDAAGVRDAARGDKDQGRVAIRSLVGAQYFRTLRLPLLRGREFTEAEERGASGVRPVVVDQALAAGTWPGADPIGQRLQLEDGQAGWSAPMEVVGVVPGIRQSLFDTEAPAHVYLPAGSEYRGQMHVHVRLRAGGRAQEAAMTESVRETVHQADRSLAILGVSTLRAQRDRSIYVWMARAGAAVFASFGIVALTLAVLGVYGVKSFLVSRRRKEIALRLALGATRRDVLRLVVGDGLILTAGGLACGLALSVALSKVLASWVYGAGGLDLVPLAAACVTLGVTALLACYAPVRRAAGRSPWNALRAD